LKNKTRKKSVNISSFRCFNFHFLEVSFVFLILFDLRSDFYFRQRLNKKKLKYEYILTPAVISLTRSTYSRKSRVFAVEADKFLIHRIIDRSVSRYRYILHKISESELMRVIVYSCVICLLKKRKREKEFYYVLSYSRRI